MLALTLGCLLMLSGAGGRFPLIGTRANALITVLGAIVGLYGVAQVLRRPVTRQEPLAIAESE